MDTFTSQLLHLWLKENPRRGGQKELEDKEVLCETVFPSYAACMRHKQWWYQWTDMLKGKSYGVSPLDQELQAINDCGEREN